MRIGSCPDVCGRDPGLRTLRARLRANNGGARGFQPFYNNAETGIIPVEFSFFP